MNILCCVAEFERELISERVSLGFKQYQQDYAAGKIGKAKLSRSGKNLAIGRPKAIFDRNKVIELRKAGNSVRQVARLLGISVGTVAGVQKTLSNFEASDSTSSGVAAQSLSVQ